jgi:hypothetical protein
MNRRPDPAMQHQQSARKDEHDECEVRDQQRVGGEARNHGERL